MNKMLGVAKVAQILRSMLFADKWSISDTPAGGLGRLSQKQVMMPLLAALAGIAFLVAIVVLNKFLFSGIILCGVQ